MKTEETCEKSEIPNGRKNLEGTKMIWKNTFKHEGWTSATGYKA
jgi:hypothetical protein